LGVCAVFAVGAGCRESGYPNALEQAKKLYGKKIEFPAAYLSVAAADSIPPIDEELARRFRIVTYLDQQSCTECALQILSHWQELLAEIPPQISVGFVPVVYPNDTAELKRALQTLQIDRPLLYDKENEFLGTNKLEKILARNRSFLLDESDRIVVIGEPLISAELWQVYKNTLEKLN
jgi:hypothetical protein